MKPAPIFEHVTCSRCAGSGEYSYNQIDGSRCYGCCGNGWVLTKRGKAARNWLVANRSTEARHLVVGQRVYFDMGMTMFWAAISAIAVQADGQIMLSCIRKSGTNSTVVPPETAIAVAVSTERLAELQRDALAYQATLTKAGVPRKTRGKAPADFNPQD